MRPLIRTRVQRKTIASRFGATVLAIAAMAAIANDANATIITMNTPVVVPNNFDGVYINLVTGATSAIQNSSFDINPYGGVNALLFYWAGDMGSINAGVAATATGPYLDLSAGTLVSSASNFSQSSNGGNNETIAFRTSGTHNLGLRFLNESTGAVNYGYLTITTTGTTGFPATITGWSYENTGAGIVVAGVADGTVPEPSTIWMMGLGTLLLGMCKLGQKRRK